MIENQHPREKSSEGDLLWQDEGRDRMKINTKYVAHGLVKSMLTRSSSADAMILSNNSAGRIGVLLESSASMAVSISMTNSAVCFTM